MFVATSPLNLPLLRQERGISLEQIAEKTKISMLSLRAIEAEAYDRLPGGIYAISYLRQYAAAIGIEDAVLLRRHAAFLKPAATAPPERAPRRILDRWLGLSLHHRG